MGKNTTLPSSSADKQTEMTDWMWGSSRGGGGAPLRDNNGNVITNLKAVVKGMDSPQKAPRRRDDYDDGDRYGGPKPPPRNRKDYDEPDYNDHRRHNDRDRDRERDNRDRGYDRRDNNGYDNGSPNGSPKKFMSALQEMNSSMSVQDRNEKQRKALEYQEMLKRQIDEKNKKKELEKRREDEEKRREYEEFMRHTKQSPQNAGGKKKPMFKQEDEDDRYREQLDRRRPPPDHGRNRNDEDEDHYRGDRRGPPPRDPPRRGGNRDDEGYNSDDSVNQYNNKHKVKAPAAIPGLPPKKSDGRRSNPDEDDYDDPPPQKFRGGGGSDRGRGGRHDEDRYSDEEPPRNIRRPGGHNSPVKTKQVSAEEYDELSALCDRLLAQQEQLQSEIKTQASIIKDLQKKQDKAGVGAKPLRSKSAVQNKRPFDDDKPPRPSSMHQAKPGAVPGRRASLGKETDQRKAVKVAFGANVINGDKKTAAGGVGGKPTNNKPSNAPPPKGGAKVPPLGGVGKTAGGRGSDNDRGNVNGFAKLQQQVSKKSGGPVVVTYEDESDYGGGMKRGGGGRSDLNLELRGQSHYIPVNDDFGGDQLDKLLGNARKGKFS